MDVSEKTVLRTAKKSTYFPEKIFQVLRIYSKNYFFKYATPPFYRKCATPTHSYDVNVDLKKPSRRAL